jgi:hypothetical protein
MSEKYVYKLTIFVKKHEDLKTSLKRMRDLDSIGDYLATKYKGNVVGSYAVENGFNVFIYFKTEDAVKKAGKEGIPAILDRYPSYPKKIDYTIKKEKAIPHGG